MNGWSTRIKVCFFLLLFIFSFVVTMFVNLKEYFFGLLQQYVFKWENIFLLRAI